MARTELDLNPVDFITIGTIGPKGRRVFHLQAGYENKLVSFIIEKEQAWALGEAIRELIEDLDERIEKPSGEQETSAKFDMDLREPIQPLFRIAQMGLAYDDESDRVILVAQEMVPQDEEDEEDEEDDDSEAGVVRMWCTRAQMRALSQHAMDTVSEGRPNPKQNGFITYYWT